MDLALGPLGTGSHGHWGARHSVCPVVWYFYSQPISTNEFKDKLDKLDNPKIVVNIKSLEKNLIQVILIRGLHIVYDS